MKALLNAHRLLGKHRLINLITALGLTIFSSKALALTPPRPADPASGATYFSANCSSCHSSNNATDAPLFDRNVASDFSLLRLSYAKGLKARVAARLAAASQATVGPMYTFSQLALDDDNLNDVAAYLRTLAPPSTITITQDYTYQTAIPGYPQAVTTAPAITVQAICSVGTDQVDTKSASIAVGSSSGSITGLLQGESCTLTQTAGPTGGGRPNWVYSFDPSSPATFTPGSISALAGTNTVTVNNLVRSPASATLRLTAAFDNNSPSHVDAATPITVNAHCSKRNADVPGSFPANGSLDLTGFAQGDSCSVSATISASVTQPSDGYTFGTFTYSPAQPTTLNAGMNPVALTNTLVAPPAQIRVKAAFLGDASRITSQPKLNLKLSCVGRTDRLDGFTTTANASVTFSGLIAGDQCQITELSVNPAAVLSDNYLLSAAPTSIEPPGNFTLVAGTNDVTVTHTVIAPGAAQLKMQSPLTFAAEVGSSDTRSTTISNGAGAGSAYLTLSALTFSDPTQYRFDIRNTCTPGKALAPFEKCDLYVTFAPVAPPPTITDGPQPRFAKLAITHDAAGSPASLDLNGTAIPAPSPSIQISDAMPAFADTYLGSSSSTTITVTNGPSATAALQISALTLSEAAAADYSLASGSGACAVGTSLVKNASCTITIRFSPSQSGQRLAKLTIGNGIPSPTPVITLGGVGIEKPVPVLSITSSTPIHFGNRTISGSYQPRFLTIENKGKADLLISAVQITGTAFSTADGCPPTMAPDAQCQLRIQYTPRTAGQRDDGSVIITSNAAGSPHAVLLDGTGVTYTAPVFVWSGAALDFGNVSAGSPSAPQPLTITNVGPGDAMLTLVNVTGVDAANFVLTMQDCKLDKPVVEGATCHLAVQFVPTASGGRKAALQWSSTGSTPAPVTLQGTGLAGVSAQLALSSSSLNFGTVRVGASSLPQELTLQSNGTSLLHVAAINVGAPYKVVSKDCAEPPFDLMPGMQCKLMLGFVPSAAGAGNATARITSNSVQAVPDVALNGEGQQEAEVSGGGCSLASGHMAFDPVLLMLALGAAIVLWVRGQREVQQYVNAESRS